MNKINKIHERAMRLVLKDYISDFDTLLTCSTDMSVHQRCINFLITEVYKYLNGLCPDLMNDVFILGENAYNLRSFHIFKSENPKSNKYGLDSIAYRSSQLWNTVPNDIQRSPSLAFFKEKIKAWSCNSCPCQLCKSFIVNLSYLSFSYFFFFF